MPGKKQQESVPQSSGEESAEKKGPSVRRGRRKGSTTRPRGPKPNLAEQIAKEQAAAIAATPLPEELEIPTYLIDAAAIIEYLQNQTPRDPNFSGLAEQVMVQEGNRESTSIPYRTHIATQLLHGYRADILKRELNTIGGEAYVMVTLKNSQLPQGQQRMALIRADEVRGEDVKSIIYTDKIGLRTMQEEGSVGSVLVDRTRPRSYYQAIQAKQQGKTA